MATLYSKMSTSSTTSSTSYGAVQYSSFLSSYRNASEVWKRRAQGRNSDKVKYVNHNGDVVLKVAHILNTCLNENRDIVQKLKDAWTMNKTKQIHDVVFDDQNLGFWFYEQRKTDIMPKNQKEVDRISNFVDFMIDVFMKESPDTQAYLRRFMSVSCCFVLWCLTTPRYFHNKLTYNTYKNKTRLLWINVVLPKKPQPQPSSSKSKQLGKTESSVSTNNIQYVSESHINSCVIPKKKEEISTLLKSLEEGLGLKKLTLGMSQYELHKMVSEKLILANLSSKQKKKMNKIYQTYQIENQKLCKMAEASRDSEVLRAQGGVELEDGRRIVMKQVHIRPSPSKSQEEEHDDESMPTENNEQEEVPESWEDMV